MGKTVKTDRVNFGGKNFDYGSGAQDINPPKFKPKSRSKYIPKGIDPAYPQKNFVKASYENKGDMDGFYEYMYGGPAVGEISKKASGYGHGVEKRAGYLRLSGHPNAHRLGKRKGAK